MMNHLSFVIYPIVTEGTRGEKKELKDRHKKEQKDRHLVASYETETKRNKKKKRKNHQKNT